MLPATGQMIKVKLLRQAVASELKSSMIGTERQTFFITIPVGLSNPHTALVPEREIEVQYHGRDGAKITFVTTVVRVSYEPPQVELVVPLRKDMRREQRREFVRVPAGLPVRMESPVKSLPQTVDVYMHDISGGGIALMVPGEVKGRVGSTVRTHFTLPRVNAHIDAKCTIIRISDPNEAGFTVWSLMFSDMKESVRQRIIQYTFLRQRELQDLNRDMSKS